jgi:transposase-like protein
MKQHFTARERAQIVSWHATHGENVAATCRGFGIARTTFYRWQARYDPGHPRASLRRQPPAPRSRRSAPKAALFFARVIALNLDHPHWGRGRVRQALQALRDDAPSEATIGRWLAEIRTRCPVCKGRNGTHQEITHVFQNALRHYLPAPSHRRKPVRASLSKPNTVAAAEKLLRRRG